MTLGSTHAYGEPSYWDKRYGQESGPFDWYQKYPALAPLLDLYLSRHYRILVVGCGNSALSLDMVDDGYEDIVNIDISSVVIDAMKRKYSDRPQLKYTQMDVRDMSPLEAGSFDSVIDKDNVWSSNLSIEAVERFMLVDQKNGLEGGPNHQKWALTSPISLDDDGSSAEATFGKNPDVHFIYVCTKDNS
ncbi:Methyltransferase type 11 [Dillenia turbinata]|uniref:Methyltransferase type 11 n=1 Tax=Dillenia turbinata TaxID=194707 RepID=A0AAN8VID5_9MAGN